VRRRPRGRRTRRPNLAHVDEDRPDAGRRGGHGDRTRYPVRRPSKLGSGKSVTFSLATAGVPPSADAVALDDTAADTRAKGSAEVYSAALDLPDRPDVVPSWSRGQTVTGLLTVPISGSKVTLRNMSRASADFMVDVVGYYDFFGNAAPSATRLLRRRGDILPGRGALAHYRGRRQGRGERLAGERIPGDRPGRRPALGSQDAQLSSWRGLGRGGDHASVLRSS
jgi:hypothetical protein